VFPDTYATLRALQERGYILGVVTNRGYGGAPFREDMRQIAFDHYFDLSAMAVSLDLGIRKPNPDIFLYALQKLGIEPGEAAMVGDSLHADIQGANLLDIFSIWRPKERIREEAKISRMHSSTQTAIAEQPSEAIADIEENDNDVFPEKEEVYQYVQQNPHWEHHISSGDVRPDHIIYTLSELLEIF
jgi:FMN phosphatase YigB (HAD superfamily)